MDSNSKNEDVGQTTSAQSVYEHSIEQNISTSAHPVASPDQAKKEDGSSMFGRNEPPDVVLENDESGNFLAAHDDEAANDDKRLSNHGVTPPSADVETEPTVAVTTDISTNETGNNLEAPVDGASQISGLEVDSGWERDSAIGTDDLSSTASIRSSVYAFQEENGRRYHKYKEGKYYFPNDEEEQDRLDLQHHLFLLTLDGKLQLAPIEKMKGGIHNVLDIATGTGIWAIEFANTFPSANVLGTDLSPIQPEYVPPNCRFEVDDAEDAWIYSRKFDFIHGRMLASCFTSHLAIFRSAFDALRPGGWIEFQDFGYPFRCIDDTLRGTAMERWLKATMDGISALGKDFGRAPFYKDYLAECGFVDIQEKQFAWPIGTWAKNKKMKTLGAWCHHDLVGGMQGLSMAILTRGLHMSLEQVELLLMEEVDVKQICRLWEKAGMKL